MIDYYQGSGGCQPLWDGKYLQNGHRWAYKVGKVRQDLQVPLTHVLTAHIRMQNNEGRLKVISLDKWKEETWLSKSDKKEKACQHPVRSIITCWSNHAAPHTMPCDFPMPSSIPISWSTHPGRMFFMFCICPAQERVHCREGRGNAV